jgi:Site-specific recombinases, DNA invertase Pin homologs
MKVGLYARVSTVDQRCELQLLELREYCARRGWTVVEEYVDTGWSGAKSSRPELDRLMQDASEHRFDALAVWKIDRLARSVLNLSEQLAQLTSWGIRFLATSQGLDTDQANPTSRLLLHILASVAEFERSLIQERIAAGMRAARARGTRSGRSIGRPRRIFDRGAVLRLREEGVSFEKIAAELGIGVGTAVRSLRDHERRAAAFQKATA